MKILRNYILKDFFVSFFFSLCSLTIVMSLGNLMKISDMVIRKGVAITDALSLFYIFIPYTLIFTIPLSTLLAILLTMGRLITDNELTAINVAGISMLHILSIFLIVGIISSLCLFILNDKVIPSLHYNYRWHTKNLFKKNLPAVIEPGVYIENLKNTIMYVDDIKANKMRHVSIYELGENGLSRYIYAKRGEFVVDGNILKIKLEDGFQEKTMENKDEFSHLDFKVNFIDLPMEKQNNRYVEKKTSDMNLKELQEEIKRLKYRKINPLKYITELHKRISFSFSPLTFILLGFGVSLIVKHREKSINFGLALFAAGIYYLLLIFGETLANFQILPPAIGMWLPNLIISIIGILMIIKNAYIR